MLLGLKSGSGLVYWLVIVVDFSPGITNYLFKVTLNRLKIRKRMAFFWVIIIELISLINKYNFMI